MTKLLVSIFVVFFVFGLILIAKPKYKVIDLDNLYIKGDVRQPNISKIESSAMEQSILKEILKKQIIDLEQSLLKPIDPCMTVNNKGD